jgi:hypothetical protein
MGSHRRVSAVNTMGASSGMSSAAPALTPSAVPPTTIMRFSSVRSNSERALERNASAHCSSGVITNVPMLQHAYITCGPPRSQEVEGDIGGMGAVVKTLVELGADTRGVDRCTTRHIVMWR